MKFVQNENTHEPLENGGTPLQATSALESFKSPININTDNININTDFHEQIQINIKH